MPEYSEASHRGSGLEQREPGRMDTAIARVEDLKGKIQTALEDPALKEGGEAAFRTFANTLVSVADLFPGVGDAVSWGADIAKVYARIKYKKDRVAAIATGKDPEKVQMSKLDLTPDVSVEVAVLTELLEVFSIGFLPTHAIEGGMQLYKDWPKLKAAAQRLREMMQKKAEIIDAELEAVQTFEEK